jgi:type II secretory ATPase GspE/PulE/Tfp pilus assembly ATPase PilB-like protein
VLSTLHTNSAPETITRLLDMGLDPFSFGDALLGVLAQRLARSLCKQCRFKEQGTAEEFAEMMKLYGAELFKEDFGMEYNQDFQLYRAKGCEACGKTGYRGRLGLHELLVTNDDIKHSIGEKEPVEKLRQKAIKAGMRTLMQDGIQKVLLGNTDMKQVLAVCSR